MEQIYQFYRTLWHLYWTFFPLNSTKRNEPSESISFIKNSKSSKLGIYIAFSINGMNGKYPLERLTVIRLPKIPLWRVLGMSSCICLLANLKSKKHFFYFFSDCVQMIEITNDAWCCCFYSTKNASQSSIMSLLSWFNFSI